MNKPIATDELMPVRDYAKMRLNRKGKPVRVQYIYKLISQHKNEGKIIDFSYREIDRTIWIVKK